MIKHTFVNKCNTIIKDSELNTGLNPVAELNIGGEVSRILLWFDVHDMRQSVLEGSTLTSNLTHRLKMTNCGGVNLPIFNTQKHNNCPVKERAVSFDLIAFKLPFEWDEGRGFDYHGDYAKETHKITSVEASNWFQARNGMKWDETGVYNINTLLTEYYDKYLKGEDSVIIASQHFDNGAENLDMDISAYINKVLNGEEPNYGIGIAFAPAFEENADDDRFISFFTNHTNTFFHPYLETINEDIILDDRAKFHIGIKNRLYFFVSDNGTYIDLDELPTCSINGLSYEVKHGGVGSYYVELILTKDEVEEDTILIDTWGNIKLNGTYLEDVEMEFITLPFEDRVKLGNYKSNEKVIVPQLSGINNKEEIKIGNIVEVDVDFIEEYSYGTKMLPVSSEYRIYVKEGGREIDVFPYQPIERRFDSQMFMVDTNQMIPNTYFVDIKVKYGRAVKYYNGVLEFKVVDNITNYYI